jgi:hypothetical protein
MKKKCDHFVGSGFMELIAEILHPAKRTSIIEIDP